ncbi:Cytochrome c4 [hydrothermal vent metagenome]|uniref:Cytochrome c4 n=1 Tax=hydrothermal vent metagenome TaxID=652676 RepID=A0A3B0XYZ9_9ZZZZ
MKKVFVAVAGSVLLFGASLSMAGGDAAAGKATAAKACAGCHDGAGAGMSANPVWPNLASQKEAYLAKQLKAFRDGTRNDPTMSLMAKPLSDADIDNLAAHYSGL